MLSFLLSYETCFLSLYLISHVSSWLVFFSLFQLCFLVLTAWPIRHLFPFLPVDELSNSLLTLFVLLSLLFLWFNIRLICTPFPVSFINEWLFRTAQCRFITVKRVPWNISISMKRITCFISWCFLYFFSPNTCPFCCISKLFSITWTSPCSSCCAISQSFLLIFYRFYSWLS